MDEFVIHMFLALLSIAVKSPARKQALKKELLHVRDGINALYPGE